MHKVIANIAANTYHPDQVVLSDDCSDDGSPECFEELCRRHGLDYRVITHEANGMPFRLNSMRNDGIKACPEGLVVVLDADLVPARTCFEAHRRIHLEHAGQLVASTGPRLEYAFPDASGPINFLWGFEMIGHVSGPAIGAHPGFPTWHVTPGSMMAMPLDAIREVGWFDTQYDGNYGYDDLDFMIRAERKGARFIGDWECHVIHVPHPPSLGHRDNGPNQAKFIAKYGFDKTYPEILSHLCRKPWNEYYQELMTNHDELISVRTLPLDSVNGWYLLSALIRRCMRRVKLLK